jgi:hypothetical protein
MQDGNSTNSRVNDALWEYVKVFRKVNTVVEFVLSSVIQQEVIKLTHFPICEDRVIVFAFKWEF